MGVQCSPGAKQPVGIEYVRQFLERIMKGVLWLWSWKLWMCVQGSSGNHTVTQSRKNAGEGLEVAGKVKLKLALRCHDAT